MIISYRQSSHVVTCHWAVPGNIQTGGAGVGDMEFPGVLKKSHVEFPGVDYKQSRISKGHQEKIMWSFQGSLLLDVEFLRDQTQFCGIFRG